MKMKLNDKVFIKNYGMEYTNTNAAQAMGLDKISVIDQKPENYKKEGQCRVVGTCQFEEYINSRKGWKTKLRTVVGLEDIETGEQYMFLADGLNII